MRAGQQAREGGARTEIKLCRERESTRKRGVEIEIEMCKERARGLHRERERAREV